jgi:hypothetical protein
MIVERVGGPEKAASAVESWWPLGLVGLAAVAAATFIGPPFPKATSSGLPLLALLAIGAVSGLVLSATTGLLATEQEEVIFPILVGVAGIFIASVPATKDRRYQNWIVASAFLRRARLRSSARDVQLVALRAVLGQVAADLTTSTLHPRGAEVHATVVGGSIVLRVPSGWTVSTVSSQEPTIHVLIPPTDQTARSGSIGSLNVSLAGFHGRLVILWSDSAPPSRPHSMTNAQK